MSVNRNKHFCDVGFPCPGSDPRCPGAVTYAGTQFCTGGFLHVNGVAIDVLDLEGLEHEVEANGFAHALSGPQSGRLRELAGECARSKEGARFGLTPAEVLAVLVYTETEVGQSFRLDVLVGNEQRLWPRLCTALYVAIRKLGYPQPQTPSEEEHHHMLYGELRDHEAEQLTLLPRFCTVASLTAKPTPAKEPPAGDEAAKLLRVRVRVPRDAQCVCGDVSWISASGHEVLVSPFTAFSVVFGDRPDDEAPASRGKARELSIQINVDDTARFPPLEVICLPTSFIPYFIDSLTRELLSCPLLLASGQVLSAWQYETAPSAAAKPRRDHTCEAALLVYVEKRLRVVWEEALREFEKGEGAASLFRVLAAVVERVDVPAAVVVLNELLQRLAPIFEKKKVAVHFLDECSSDPARIDFLQAVAPAAMQEVITKYCTLNDHTPTRLATNVVERNKSRATVVDRISKYLPSDSSTKANTSDYVLSIEAQYLSLTRTEDITSVLVTAMLRPSTGDPQIAIEVQFGHVKHCCAIALVDDGTSIAREDGAECGWDTISEVDSSPDDSVQVFTPGLCRCEKILRPRNGVPTTVTQILSFALTRGFASLALPLESTFDDVVRTVQTVVSFFTDQTSSTIKSVIFISSDRSRCEWARTALMTHAKDIRPDALPYLEDLFHTDREGLCESLTNSIYVCPVFVDSGETHCADFLEKNRWCDPVSRRPLGLVVKNLLTQNLLEAYFKDQLAAALRGLTQHSVAGDRMGIAFALLAAVLGRDDLSAALNAQRDLEALFLAALEDGSERKKFLAKCNATMLGLLSIVTRDNASLRQVVQTRASSMRKQVGDHSQILERNQHRAALQSRLPIKQGRPAPLQQQVAEHCISIYNVDPNATDPDLLSAFRQFDPVGSKIREDGTAVVSFLTLLNKTAAEKALRASSIYLAGRELALIPEASPDGGVPSEPSLGADPSEPPQKPAGTFARLNPKAAPFMPTSFGESQDSHASEKTLVFRNFIDRLPTVSDYQLISVYRFFGMVGVRRVALNIYLDFESKIALFAAYETTSKRKFKLHDVEFSPDPPANFTVESAGVAAFSQPGSTVFTDITLHREDYEQVAWDLLSDTAANSPVLTLLLQLNIKRVVPDNFSLHFVSSVAADLACCQLIILGLVVGKSNPLSKNISELILTTMQNHFSTNCKLLACDNVVWIASFSLKAMEYVKTVINEAQCHSLSLDVTDEQLAYVKKEADLTRWQNKHAVAIYAEEDTTRLVLHGLVFPNYPSFNSTLDPAGKELAHLLATQRPKKATVKIPYSEDLQLWVYALTPTLFMDSRTKYSGISILCDQAYITIRGDSTMVEECETHFRSMLPAKVSVLRPISTDSLPEDSAMSFLEELNRRLETQFLPVCKEHGIGLVTQIESKARGIVAFTARLVFQDVEALSQLAHKIHDDIEGYRPTKFEFCPPPNDIKRAREMRDCAQSRLNQLASELLFCFVVEQEKIVVWSSTNPDDVHAREQAMQNLFGQFFDIHKNWPPEFLDCKVEEFDIVQAYYMSAIQSMTPPNVEVTVFSTKGAKRLEFKGQGAADALLTIKKYLVSLDIQNLTKELENRFWEVLKDPNWHQHSTIQQSTQTLIRVKYTGNAVRDDAWPQKTNVQVTISGTKTNVCRAFDLLVIALEREVGKEPATKQSTIPKKLSVESPNSTNTIARTMHGQTIQLQRCFLQQCVVDAVVNPTNTMFINDGGASRAISQACGQEWELRCRATLSRLRLGEFPVGKACLFDSGNATNFRWVINAVGPRMRHRNKPLEAKSILVEVVTEILDAVQHSDIKSLAIPAFGTGDAGCVTGVVCASVMLTVILDYLFKHPNSTLRSVVFCLAQGNIYDDFVNELLFQKGS